MRTINEQGIGRTSDLTNTVNLKANRFWNAKGGSLESTEEEKKSSVVKVFQLVLKPNL